MRKFSSIYIIASFALLIRLVLFFLQQSWDPIVLEESILVRDPLQYHQMAIDIMETGTFQSILPHRTPGYPTFIFLIYSVFGTNPWVVLLLQILINIATLWLIYIIAKILFSKSVALIGAFIYSVEPLAISNSLKLLSDTVFVFVVLAAIALFIFGLDRKKYLFLLYSAAIFGLATLIKPVTQYMPYMLIILMLMHAKLTWSFKLKTVSLFLITFLSVTLMWNYRNYVVHGHFSYTSMNGLALLYSATYADVKKTGKPFEDVKEEFFNKAIELGVDEDNSPFENAKLHKKVAIDYIKKNPKIYTTTYLHGILNIYTHLHTYEISRLIGVKGTRLPYEYYAPSNIFSKIKLFFTKKSLHEIVLGIMIGTYLLIVYIGFFRGSMIMYRNKEYFFLALLLLIILYFTLISGTLGSARYKLPIIPIYTILSAVGIHYFIQRLFRRAREEGV
ncbi:MAG: glycosyltransferase family 39 protein [Bacteroidetes bacterium]|nr:glycosyltransferase family 39 protein [Bacteroidota bacterium]